MQQFNIGTQITNDIENFHNKRVNISNKDQNISVRTLKRGNDDYSFSQRDTIGLIDNYYNSRFESGEYDSQGQKKIFLNVGKFRSEVSSKQIDIDTKDFRFLPDDYADTYTALFMQKDFKEWAKDSDFGEIVNWCVETYPKYGSVVLKKVGTNIKPMPLQNLMNEQTADCLQEAAYVIEQHPNMYHWELERMKNWDMTGVEMRYGETLTVYERYGYVPRKWLANYDSSVPVDADEMDWVDAVVIAAKLKQNNKKGEGWHVFYAAECKERPYREAHWARQHGRWLGIGVIEDLFENQKAQNIVANLVRKSMEWSGKRIFQSSDQSVAEKNLVRDVQDGTILEVGQQGAITEVPLSAKTNADFTSFVQMFEKNSDQKAFTYEVATGEALPSGTPFRLGVVLSNATNSFFQFKREKLGLFLKSAIEDFLIPQFLKDMGNKEKVVAMFNGESGFDILKDAAMQYVQSEAARVAILSGSPVDTSVLSDATEPFQVLNQIFFKLPPMAYKEAKYKFDFTVTGEEIDLPNKIESLKAIATSLQTAGDPRFMRVLERIAALVGEDMAKFGTPQKMNPVPIEGQGATSPLPNVPNAPTPANAAQ